MNEQIPRRAQRLRRGSGRVTMAEVARLAGVSMSTVSRVLRAPDIVSEDLIQRVKSAVDQLGYVPNQMAGGLAQARARIIGVVLPSIRNAFFSSTVNAMAEVMGPQGWTVLDASHNYDLKHEEELVERLLSWSPSAMVLTGFDHTPRTRLMLQGANIPVIEMWDIDGTPFDVAVGFSHKKVGATLTDHLVKKGRRKIVFVGASLEKDIRAKARAEGYASAVRAANLGEPRIVNLATPTDVAAGAKGLAQALQQYPDLDAIVCASDVIALGVLFECHRRGIKVPQQIAVTGFGDLDFAGECLPPLTTVRPRGDMIGQKVAELLLRRLEGVTSMPPIFDLGFEFIERQSA